jgi:hypothetical protein
MDINLCTYVIMNAYMFYFLYYLMHERTFDYFKILCNTFFFPSYLWKYFLLIMCWNSAQIKTSDTSYLHVETADPRSIDFVNLVDC